MRISFASSDPKSADGRIEPMRLATIIILVANTLPILAGILGYQALIGPFQSPYVFYTFAFWSIAAGFFIAVNHDVVQKIPDMLRRDLALVGTQRFFLFVTALMFLLNMQWFASSREMGIDNRGLVFKLFFLLEDLYFVVFILILFRALTRRKLIYALVLILAVYPMIALFGRLSIITSAALAYLLINSNQSFLSRRVLVSISALIFFVFLGVWYIEVSRAGAISAELEWNPFLDRVGEFATLNFVDDIFLASLYDSFEGFENLRYLWAPSVLFPEKPFINDGAIYLRTQFNLGAGENPTRFPIMLHVDSFRRFGWAGLWIAVLPGVAFRFMMLVVVFFDRRFGVPFLSLVAMKYAVFFFPKSVLGLIEIVLYTFIRSAIVFLILILFYRMFARSFPRRLR